MAKKPLKTQGNPIGKQLEQATGDIEYLFKVYRELNEKVDLNAEVVYAGEAWFRATLADHGERIVALEYEGGDGGLSDEELDQMIEEAMAARPWYAKMGSWLTRDQNGLLVASIGLATTFVVGMIALLAR